MPNLYSRKSRPFFFIFIMSCCLMIMVAGAFLIQPSSNSNSLDVLLLNKNAAPTFRLTSQLTYTPELMKSWNALFNNSTSQSNLSTLEDDTLHLYIPLEKTTLKPNALVKDLKTMSKVFPKIFISIVPAPDMTDALYLEQCQTLHQALIISPSLDVTLVAYPLTKTELALYDQDFIGGIGTVLTTQMGTVLSEEVGTVLSSQVGTVLSEDLELLDAIYDLFAGKKMLYVRDEIKDFYGTSKANVAAQEITSLYYNLAIQYPAVDTIFSPFTVPNSIYEKFKDSYLLSHQDENYYLFYTVYNRLIDKSWITTGKETRTFVSPYVPLKSYDLLSDEVEIVLNPSGNLFSRMTALKNSKDGHCSVSFKWNASGLSTLPGYPYGVTVDTVTVPNGISRLKAILQDSNGRVLEVQSLDLRIKHPIDVVRAQRIQSAATSTPPGTEIESHYVPILMYHTVDDTVLPESQNSCVETKNFDAQMKALIDNGYTPINFSDLKAYARGTVLLPERPVIITMDDGYLNNYTKAYPVYKKYGIQATLFVSPYYVAENNTTRHFGWAAAREMEASGLIDIQPHGYDHTPFPYLSVEDLKHHITLSKSIIEQQLGPRDVWVVACPEFRNTIQTRKVLASLGVDFQITSLAKKGTVLSPTSLKRINVPNTMTPNELIATLNQFTG